MAELASIGSACYCSVKKRRFTIFFLNVFSLCLCACLCKSVKKEAAHLLNPSAFSRRSPVVFWKMCSLSSLEVCLVYCVQASAFIVGFSSASCFFSPLSPPDIETERKSLRCLHPSSVALWATSSPATGPGSLCFWFRFAVLTWRQLNPCPRN